jgi:non-specific serine/threonine protein kinase
MNLRPADSRRQWMSETPLGFAHRCLPLRSGQRRLALLSGGVSDLPQRQQALQTALAWSHDLLEPSAQLLFRRLAVFAGGWTLEAAQAVCGGADLSAEEVLDRLQVLVESSLARRLVGLEPGLESRFGMLETIREYATEKLLASGEMDSIRARHTEFYSRLAEPVDAAARSIWLWVQSPALSDHALDMLETEIDNLAAALDWWLSTSSVAEAVRLAVALNWLCSRHWRNATGRRWLEAVHDVADRAAPASAFRAERAVALTEIGILASRQGDPQQALAFFRRSLDVRRELDDAPGLAIGLATLGLAEWLAGDAQRATTLLEEALSRSRAAKVPHTVAVSLRNLGLVVRSQGQYARAESLFSEAAAQALPVGWYRGYSISRSLSCLGRVAALQQDVRRARALFKQALELIRQMGLTGQALGDCLDWQAALEAIEGDFVRAARLFGAAENHWRTSGARRYLPDEAAYERDLAMVRDALNHEAFATAWAEERAMQPDEVIAYALQHSTQRQG